MKSIGIIGASGYTGQELLAILQNHKGVSIDFLNSRSYAGRKVSSLYPKLKGVAGLRFTNHSVDEINAMRPDLVFLAMPDGNAMETVPRLKCRAIDLSGDYRFRDVSVYERNYGIEHRDPKHEAVYGLPEMFREEIKKARVVANPGCYVTASVLAALPLQDSAEHMVFDCKSGFSGAGKKPCYVNDPKHYRENIIAYKISTHRHAAEIAQFLKPKVYFTPHVIPVFRGIMCTMHALLAEGLDRKDLMRRYEEFYAGEPFVKLKHETPPELHDVQNTNNCVLGGFEVDSNNRAVVVSTIDNLVKGASGQAVQNMNLMLGFGETEALL